MLKTRDFYLIKVYDIKGKYLGVIDDIAIDFYKGQVIGFFISNFSLFSKKNYIDKKEIISINEVVIVNTMTHYNGLSFKEIKDMDIMDNNNTMRGVLEDLIIEKKDLSIKGIIMSSGIFDKMLKGKEILLLKQCILGEDFILYSGNDAIRLQTLPHNIREYDKLKQA
ncbi:PRC-barrel domain-containing protein [Clostridium gasigenes]|uniref:PRC-barrel domain-containing protein n=1 Tax=Clostridium gasigenes TaxID=94869 RepID=UPI001438535A|nr:PRC-barrel domain-containing protein [Clostridium gasigenes]NKF05948.1 photosystem reaction center subunit H [Clostridium gasigenes]QSW19326.1 PRC-barrel domain-containing protein [Clostridium gasigenes]